MTEQEETTKEEIFETNKLLGQASDLRDLIDSPGWKEAKIKLFKKLIQLDSVNALDMHEKEDAQIVRELERRRDLFAFIKDWLAEIEGEGKSTDFNKDLARIREDEIVIEFN